MFKFNKLLFIFIGTILLSSCLTNSTEGYLYNSDLSVSTRAGQGIDGSYVIDDLLVFRKGLYNREVFILSYINPDYANPFFAITAIYDGQGWQFRDEIRLKLNEAIFTLTDDKPVRTVISGGRVVERNMMVLESTMLNNMLQSENMEIQYLSHTEISHEYLNEIKRFITPTVFLLVKIIVRLPLSEYLIK